MLRFLADHNFNEHVVRSLAGSTGADVVLARNVGLDEMDDPDVLEWAARDGRVLLTHDRETMIGFAYQRIRTGQPMPGVIVVKDKAAIGHVIDDLAFVTRCATEEDCRNAIIHLPWPK